MYAKALKKLIENHGFIAFTNADQLSVSWWLPDSKGGMTLMTATSLKDVNTQLGY